MGVSSYLVQAYLSWYVVFRRGPSAPPRDPWQELFASVCMASLQFWLQLRLGQICVSCSSREPFVFPVAFAEGVRHSFVVAGFSCLEGRAVPRGDDQDLLNSVKEDESLQVDASAC